MKLKINRNIARRPDLREGKEAEVDDAEGEALLALRRSPVELIPEPPQPAKPAAPPVEAEVAGPPVKRGKQQASNITPPVKE